VEATAFTTTEPDGTQRTNGPAGPLWRRHLMAVWTAWALCCVAAMIVLPGHESVPYHLGWVGFALALGFGTWRSWQLVASLTWYTLASAAVLERSRLHGHIIWDEAAEISLMVLLAVLIAWLVRRSRTAQAQVTKLAEGDAQSARDREQLMQLTSHELRTPLTIARGYIEVMQTRELEDPQDLSVIADELDRLAQVSDRLIRMMKLQDDRTMEVIDVDQVMAQSVERWRVVAHRRWVLDAHAGHCLGSAGRLRTILDTLVENAIRYTSVGDTIRLAGSRQAEHIIVSVFDSGVGLSDQQIRTINTGESSAHTAGSGSAEPVLDTDPDHLAGTGLGLSIVRRAVQARGGTLLASHAPEGGAGLTITYPMNQPRDIGRFDP